MPLQSVHLWSGALGVDSFVLLACHLLICFHNFSILSGNWMSPGRLMFPIPNLESSIFNRLWFFLLETMLCTQCVQVTIVAQLPLWSLNRGDEGCQEGIRTHTRIHPCFYSCFHPSVFKLLCTFLGCSVVRNQNTDLEHRLPFGTLMDITQTTLCDEFTNWTPGDGGFLLAFLMLFLYQVTFIPDFPVFCYSLFLYSLLWTYLVMIQINYF